MSTDKHKKFNTYGDEAPGCKDFLIVLAVFIILVVLSWLAYYKLLWLH